MQLAYPCDDILLQVINLVQVKSKVRFFISQISLWKMDVEYAQ